MHDGRRRFRTDQRGITSWHCFSAGPHYDPERLGFGPVVGCDEHLVEPGYGFDWHAHRGVRIASWVLEGVLRHEDDSGASRLVAPGELFVQEAGALIRHAETNASDDELLRFVQLTVLDGAPVRVSVERQFCDNGPAFVYVARGRFTNEAVDPLPAGDWLTLDGGAGDGGDAGDLVVLEGAGELLVTGWRPGTD